MQGHELHAVFPGLALRLARLERGMREERNEFGEPGLDVFGRAFEAARDVDELVEVLDARFRAATRIGLVVVAQAAALDRMIDLFGERDRSRSRRTGIAQ